MKATFPLFLVLLGCLLLSACVTTSVQPLSAPETAQPDLRLLGEWKTNTDDSETTFVFTRKKGAWMHVVVTEQAKEKPEAYDFFPTVIGKNTFLNVVLPGKDPQGNPTRAYVFIRYTLSLDRKLQMRMMDQDAMAHAVQAGKLKGIVQKNDAGDFMGKPLAPDVDVTLQDTSANLTKFIAASNVKRLFNEKMDTLYRTKPAHP